MGGNALIPTWPACPSAGTAQSFRESVHFLELSVSGAGELLQEIAAQNGRSLNASAVGRRLGVSAHAVLNRLALLEAAGVIRALPSLASGRPHVLLRDCQLLMHLGGRGLLQTCLTERIIAGFAAGTSAARFSCWECGRESGIDLAVATSHEKIGFLFTERHIPGRKDWRPLRLGIERGVVNRGFLVHYGIQAFVTARVVIALPAMELARHMDRWLACGSIRDARELLRKVNSLPLTGGNSPLS